MTTTRSSPLDEAYDRLASKMPGAIARAMQGLRKPRARWIRIPVGVLCIAASALWFLPVLGLWMLPLGLLFLAQDIRVLRRPVGRMMLWLLDRWDALMKRYFKGRGARGASGAKVSPKKSP